MRGVYTHNPEALDPKGEIRSSIEKALKEPERYVDRLNLGCGPDYLEGWTNLDGDPTVKAEIHCELDSRDVHIPVQKNSFDYIYASHILEHIWYLPQLKRELVRILRPNGLIAVVVPHYLSEDAWGDDTHCRAFGQASFSSGFWPQCEIRLCQLLHIKGKDNVVDRAWLVGVMEKCLDL